MKIKKGKHIVEVYDSIAELPIKRFHKFTKYQMYSLDIGSSFEDYDSRMKKTYEYLHSGLIQEAIQELNNKRMTVFNAMNEFTPLGKCLAVLVKSIDKRKYTELNEDVLDDVVQRLDEIGFTYEDVVNAINSAKKKLDYECSVYFPTEFSKRLNDNVLRKAMVSIAVCDYIINPTEETESEADEAQKEYLVVNSPNEWNTNVAGNLEQKIETEFSMFGISIASETKQNLNTMTVFDFYSTVVMLKERHKNRKK